MKLVFDSEGFSKHIRQKRIIDKNVDLRTLAKILQISTSTLSRVENGRMPELSAYAKICHWIGKPMNHFIKVK